MAPLFANRADCRGGLTGGELMKGVGPFRTLFLEPRTGACLSGSFSRRKTSTMGWFGLIALGKVQTRYDNHRTPFLLPMSN
jgi:hypothetical protein